MQHLVLLGDSIFDNAPYVAAGADVLTQLRKLQGADDIVTLFARDGDVLADMAGQVARLSTLQTPPSWLFVSCGGNDVLGLVGEMQRGVRSVLEGCELLASWQASFQQGYIRMLELVLAQGHPTVVSTIYDSVPGLSPGLRTALAAFNDVILREATRRRVPVLDLRLVCTEPSDYSTASPIEPSALGAVKIAAAIAALVATHVSNSPNTVVYSMAMPVCHLNTRGSATFFSPQNIGHG